jgi:DNA invertase Pin-like site-specific DNA recombinase
LTQLPITYFFRHFYPVFCSKICAKIKVSKVMTFGSFGIMKIGYARVSTQDQNIDLQMDALKAAGCDKVFVDEGISGSKTDRPQLNAALEFVREGDSLVVWRLDRLGRSLPHLIHVVTGLGERGIHFQSLQETIDTASATGKLVFHLMAAMAQFERDLIRERTNAGLAAARARGRNGGRPKTLTPEQIKVGRALSKNSEVSVSEICKQLGCSRSTYYRDIAPKAPKTA